MKDDNKSKRTELGELGEFGLIKFLTQNFKLNNIPVTTSLLG